MTSFEAKVMILERVNLMIMQQYRILTAPMALIILTLMSGCQGSSSSTEDASSVNVGPIDETPVETPGPSQAIAQVSWNIPTTRILGDFLPMSELQGYRVYYGTSPGNYMGNIDVQGAQDTSVDITLDSGQTYYIVVRAIDTDGFEGPESNTVTRSL